MTLDKLPPHATEAETALLGSVLLDSECLLNVMLEAGDFYHEENGQIFTAMQALQDRGECVDLITVASELEATMRLREVGGSAYLASLLAQTPTSLNAEYYASLVKKASLSRRMIQAAGKIAQLGYENKAPIDLAVTQAEELIYALREGSPGKGLVHISELLTETVTEIMRPKDSDERRSVPTGFVDLDAILGGLHATDLIVLAARPGMGKSAFMLNITEYVAKKQRAKVGVFSLEMAAGQLVERLISGRAGIELQRLRQERLSIEEHRAIQKAQGELAELGIYVDDKPMQKVSEIRGKAKRLATQVGLDLLVVDYLGFVAGSGGHEGRVQEVGDIVKGLKTLAREMDVPVLLACQLNRTVEGRVPHIPMLSDLRESGEIEQTADVVLFIYREDTYVTEEEWNENKRTNGKAYPKGLADIIVAKQRNGPTGQARLVWHEEQTTFSNLEMYRQEPARGWSERQEEKDDWLPPF